ncbi:hypothetical protein B0H66DRAFT_578790 [Apodospora peruviana]|uniref:Zn(2)-C6 fungal-type domain-containing protein n=1 Tax=Apodospora peruviana TaxID=516989 RepID=A0AAE0LXZ9_9PEZI|nr:hypothetical protein B0H66DRAFT_578790 [Apodospora peruviana]
MSPLSMGALEDSRLKRTRTKTGCSTCRKRRVKCDEVRPTCFHCRRLSLACDWSRPPSSRERKEQKKREAKKISATLEHDELDTSLSVSGVEDGILDPATTTSISSFGFIAPCEGIVEAIDPLTWLFPPLPINDPTGFLASLPSVAPLTEEDRQALNYYRSEIAFGFGSKSPMWSTHAIIMKIARTSPTVLHLLLAASSGEVGWNVGGAYSPILDNAEDNYKRGRRLLAGTILNPDSDPLEVMASFWFLYLYQRRRPAKLRIAYSALSELMSEYICHSRLYEILSEASTALAPPGPKYTPERKALLARLTTWLFWVDAQAGFQGSGGIMARLLARSKAPQGIFAMYKVSMETLKLNWDMYPDEEKEDDIKNSSPLKLIHHTWVLVQELNEASLQSFPFSPAMSRAIKVKIEALRRKSSTRSVFGLAESSARVRNRLLANSDWAVANFYALCIYWFRCSVPEGGREIPKGEPLRLTLDGEEQSITEMVEALIVLIQKSLTTRDKGQTDRLQWPLFWAGIEVAGKFKEDWVFERLTSPGLRSALEFVLLEHQAAGGRRVGVGRIRQICQMTCSDVSGVDMGIWVD